MNPITSSIVVKAAEKSAPSLAPLKRATSLALAILMALGLVLSTFLNAPWYIPLAFFTLTLVFLYPLTRRVEAQTDSMFFSH